MALLSVVKTVKLVGRGGRLGGTDPEVPVVDWYCIWRYEWCSGPQSSFTVVIWPYFVLYCYASYKFVYIYHVVWGYFYIILFTIIVRCNGKHTGELGRRKEKWDSWWGKVGQFHISLYIQRY